MASTVAESEAGSVMSGMIADIYDDVEESQKPISLQLKRYKPRDLSSSHQVRTRCKIFPPKTLLRKTVIGPNDGGNRNLDFTDIEFPSYYKSLADGQDEGKRRLGEPKSFVEPTETTVVRSPSPSSDDGPSFKDWLASRKKLRSDLDNLGLHSDWLKRKPMKTELEERVLKKTFASPG